VNPRDGFVVELLGPPGAGKSGLARALGEIAGVTIVKDHNRHDVAAAARSVPHALPVALSHPPEGVDRVRWAAWAGRLAAAPRVARHRLADGAGTVVFDQGAAYTLVRMLEVRRYPAGNAWWWRRSIETADLLDLLVILDADTETLLHRIGSRDKAHRVGGQPAEVVRGYLARERASCHLVADVLAREGTHARRVITTEVSIPEQAEIVMTLLHRRAPHRV
jgi:cytidylate kinase